MTVKTNELEGIMLNQVVAHCVEQSKPFPIYCDGKPMSKGDYSTDWSLAGPIIEREWIEVVPWPNESDENERWQATQHDLPSRVYCSGPTPLIAAMRCYVASKLGDEIKFLENEEEVK